MFFEFFPQLKERQSLSCRGGHYLDVAGEVLVESRINRTCWMSLSMVLALASASFLPSGVSSRPVGMYCCLTLNSSLDSVQGSLILSLPRNDSTPTDPLERLNALTYMMLNPNDDETVVLYLEHHSHS